MSVGIEAAFPNKDQNWMNTSVVATGARMDIVEFTGHLADACASVTVFPFVDQPADTADTSDEPRASPPPPREDGCRPPPRLGVLFVSAGLARGPCYMLLCWLKQNLA